MENDISYLEEAYGDLPVNQKVGNYNHKQRGKRSISDSSQHVARDQKIKENRQLREELGFGLGNSVDEIIGDSL